MIKISNTAASMFCQKIFAAWTQVTDWLIYYKFLFTCSRTRDSHFLFVFFNIFPPHGVTSFCQSGIKFVRVRTRVLIFFSCRKGTSYFHFLPTLAKAHTFETLWIKLRFNIVRIRRRRCWDTMLEKIYSFVKSYLFPFPKDVVLICSSGRL